MGEGGHRVRGAEAREGAALVGVEQACMSCQSGEPDGEDAFEDLRDGFEENNDAERSQGVVGWLARLVQHDPVCMFESGGVVPKGGQGGEEVQEETGVDGVYLLPDRVQYPVRGWSERGGGFG